jgi:hypothetical protein
MADGVVAVRMIAHLQHHQIPLIETLGKPVGIDQEIGLCAGRVGEEPKYREQQSFYHGVTSFY